MKIIQFTILLCLAMLSGTVKAQTIMKAISFNIKYDNVHDKENNWLDRRTGVIKLVQHYQPQVLGTQEGMPHQVSYMDEKLPDYNFIGKAREGEGKGEYSAIFYDVKQLKVLEQGTFWLSDTPSQVSKGWDAALPRVCTYGLFKTLKGNDKFWVFNTHFDHIGKKARLNSAKLILQKIKALNKGKLPVVLMGDLNTLPTDEPIQMLNEQLTDAASISKKPIYGPKGTFNAFEPAIVTKRIDYFFVAKCNVLSYTHLDDRLPNHKYISDHYPILIEVAF